MTVWRHTVGKYSIGMFLFQQALLGSLDLSSSLYYWVDTVLNFGGKGGELLVLYQSIAVLPNLWCPETLHVLQIQYTALKIKWQ